MLISSYEKYRSDLYVYLTALRDPGLSWIITSTMLYIVLSMQIIEEHILTGLGLLTFNEYVNQEFLLLPDITFWSFPG